MESSNCPGSDIPIELNSLVRGEAPTGGSETVSLSTLDGCLETHRWRDIDFMKIDAEGEETNILKGGARFFAEQSPLIQYEIKAGSELHLDLVEAFAALEYRSYRLDTSYVPDGDEPVVPRVV